jgi:hypothetical protein
VSEPGCTRCGRFGTPGFVPSTVPVGHAANPYPYAVAVSVPCTSCNAVRSVVHSAGRSHHVTKPDGWPETWTGDKNATAPHPGARGLPSDPEAGNAVPPPPEFVEAFKLFKTMRDQVQHGQPLTEEQRDRLDDVCNEAADKLDEREARRKARGSHPAGSGDLPRAKGRELRPGGGRDGKPGSGGRDHLRSVP